MDELKDINIGVKIALLAGVVLTIKALEAIYIEDSLQCKTNPQGVDKIA